MIRSVRILAACGGLLLAVRACHEPTERTVTGEAAHETESTVSPPPLERMGHPRIRIPVDVDEPDRWLFVEKVREEAPGAWATGSFDPKRNKLDIRTRDVRRFAIDVSRIPINWERLVVIGIDGVNSELRRRDYSVFHFRRSRHGQWVVDEP